MPTHPTVPAHWPGPAVAILPHLAKKSVNVQVVEPLGSLTAAAGSALYAAVALNPLELTMRTSICTCV